MAIILTLLSAPVVAAQQNSPLLPDAGTCLAPLANNIAKLSLEALMTDVSAKECQIASKKNGESFEVPTNVAAGQNEKNNEWNPTAERTLDMSSITVEQQENKIETQSTPMDSNDFDRLDLDLLEKLIEYEKQRKFYDPKFYETSGLFKKKVKKVVPCPGCDKKNNIMTWLVIIAVIYWVGVCFFK